MGIKKDSAVNAVGGIRSEMAPAHVCVPDQIDYTWGDLRRFFESELEPVTILILPSLSMSVSGHCCLESSNELRIPVSDNAVYGCTQGPRLETAAK